jgi:hypothetical protein
MQRKLLPPDSWGITPRSIRAQTGESREIFYGPGSTFFRSPGCSDGKMTTKQERTKQASAAIDALFKSNPEQSKKQVAIDVATERSDIRRRRKAAPIEEQEAIKAKPTESTSKASPRREIDVARLPVLDAPWLKIQERVFTIADPDREFEDLRERLKLTEALTPMNLETALNNAEDCARRAHALYINARLEFEAYEHEMTPVLEAMREAANSDLQDEKRLMKI